MCWNLVQGELTIRTHKKFSKPQTNFAVFLRIFYCNKNIQTIFVCSCRQLPLYMESIRKLKQQGFTSKVRSAPFEVRFYGLFLQWGTYNSSSQNFCANLVKNWRDLAELIKPENSWLDELHVPHCRFLSKNVITICNPTF